MRDAIIVIGFLAVIGLGYRLIFGSELRIGPSLGQPAVHASAQGHSSATKKSFHSERESILGVTHERSNDPENESDDSTSAFEATTTEKLPTIYSEQRFKQQAIDSSDGEGASSSFSKSSTSEARPKVVHGVPLKAFAKSQEFNIAHAPVSAPAKSGLRVFLQCMELKSKGSELLEKNECASLLTNANSAKSLPY